MAGQGQIIERGKNKYMVRVPLGTGANGKRLYHNKTIHGNKKDAQRYRTKILRQRTWASWWSRQKSCWSHTLKDGWRRRPGRELHRQLL